MLLVITYQSPLEKAYEWLFFSSGSGSGEFSINWSLPFKQRSKTQIFRTKANNMVNLNRI